MFSVIDLELDLLDSDRHIKCQGKIVWSIRRKLIEEKKPLFYDLGIEFFNLKEDDQKRLGELIQRLVNQAQKTANR